MRRSYKTDLVDAEWGLIKHLFEYRTTFKIKHSRREILNAIFYVLRTGCQWTNLPHDFPPWQTVYTNFRNWQLKGLFEKINEELRSQLRLKENRHEQASGAMIDSQSVKTTEKGGLAEDMMGLKKLREERGIFSSTLRGFYYRLKSLQAIVATKRD